MQLASVDLGMLSVNIELPDADAEVMAGVRWGEVYAFPTPAYWAYQVVARRLESTPVRYKLGSTLREELGACLLGGHGIPAKVGIAAFEHLRSRGAFADATPDESTLAEWLSESLLVEGRTVRYRFAKQKAAYLAKSLKCLDEGGVPTSTGRALRNWLLKCPGVGHKTASWVARNWLDADDIAILDIHILRAGIFAGVFSPHMAVERDYIDMERLFLDFSQGMGVRASELDAVIWYVMMSAPRAVQSLVDRLPSDLRSAGAMPSGSRSQKRRANTSQLSFLG
ncbi:MULTISPECIES: 8-oxoguanine DNA glycosylase [Luteibacter]|uniref:8-oxoguanine DNA glycosylase n=1 Tax=Luteibacter TaxID=242605 RepID=UPI000568B64B|nr:MULTISPECIES: 8-oxoguanine DNA glycosylase [unclassified Luteibacter]